jgi:hypothetical protein
VTSSPATSSPATSGPASSGPVTNAGGVGRSVRRIIIYGVLFVLVCLAAGGIGDLLTRLIDSGRMLFGNDVSGLAVTLAFTLIAGPLAALLWWYAWRTNAAQRERLAVSWGLYTVAMSTVALIAATTALLQSASSLVNGSWEPAAFSSGVVWLGVWSWHRWMRRHPTRGPLRLTGAAPTIGYAYGIAIGAAGGVGALSVLLGTAISSSVELVAIGDAWWIAALQGLIWAVGGAGIWWWYWKHDGAEALRAGLANVALVLVAGLGSVILALGGIATGLFVALRLFFDTTDGGDPAPRILEPLGTSIAAAAIGALIWSYYRRPAADHSVSVSSATRLVASGITLVAVATGIGIIVNSIFAAVGAPLVETGTRTLLLGGISALVVGSTTWWLVWKPTATVSAAREVAAGRRIYLIAVFGLSAIVAIITVLVIGFNIFDFALDPVIGGSVLDRIRSELGLLVATGLVAGYHFTLWNRDRAQKAAEPTKKQTIGQLTLVVSSDASRVAQLFADATGAKVSVLLRADTILAAEAITDAQVEAAVEGVIAVRAIVIVGETGEIEVIPLLA